MSGLRRALGAIFPRIEASFQVEGTPAEAARRLAGHTPGFRSFIHSSSGAVEGEVSVGSVVLRCRHGRPPIGPVFRGRLEVDSDRTVLRGAFVASGSFVLIVALLSIGVLAIGMRRILEGRFAGALEPIPVPLSIWAIGRLALDGDRERIRRHVEGVFQTPAEESR